jgi:glycosyltransferase involved in cell wall biosynthesis
LSDRIVWTPILSQPALAERYRMAAALVIPALDEGLGLTAIEAALSETPVIAFASGGLPDCVRDGETGFLVPPRDIDGLAQAIDSLIGDPARARALGRAGRVMALGRFGVHHVAAVYSSLYRHAIDHRGP